MFLGLDLSLSGSGLVIIDDDYKIIEKRVMHFNAIDTERLIFLEEDFLNILKPYQEKIKLVCYESPAYKAEGKLVEIGEWLGVVKTNLHKLGLNVIKAAPNQIKKYVSGKGVGDKNLIILDVYKNFGEEIRQDDEADAYIASRISHDYYKIFKEKENLELKKYQIEVLNKINESISRKELI